MAIQPRNLIIAKHAQRALSAHQWERGTLSSATKQEALTSLLNGILHLCDRDSLDFGAAMQQATNEYLDQTDEAEQ